MSSFMCSQTVDHQILLSVLSNGFYVDLTALNCFKSYLTDRTQIYTHAGSKHSASRSTAVFPRVPFSAHSALRLTPRMSPTWWTDTTYNFTCTLTTPSSSIAADQLTPLHCDCEHVCPAMHPTSSSGLGHAAWSSTPARHRPLSTDCSIHVGTSTIQPSAVERDLGFHLDGELCMKQRVAKVATACFYHLRRLRQIRRRIGEEVTTRLVLALVIPRLDYCNSLLAGIPLCTTEALQRVQNVAARLIFDLGQGSSSASGPSLTPARTRGTHCRAISAIQSTLIVLGSS